MAGAGGCAATGSRTMNRAPPSGRLATAIRPSWRSTIDLAIARPRPVPPAAAPGARQNRSNTWGMSSGRMPGSVVVDLERSPRVRSLRTRTRTRAAARRVADRVVDEDDDELAEAGLVAVDDRRLRIERRAGRRASAAVLTSAPAPSAAMSPRSTGSRVRRDRPRVGAGEEEEVLDERGQVADLGVDVVEGLRSRPRRLAAVPAEMLDRAPDDRQRRPQLVARVGGELALAAEGRALLDERLADRDEGAAGVERRRTRTRRGRRRAPPTRSTVRIASSVCCSAVRSWMTWM